MLFYDCFHVIYASVAEFDGVLVEDLVVLVGFREVFLKEC